MKTNIGKPVAGRPVKGMACILGLTLAVMLLAPAAGAAEVVKSGGTDVWFSAADFAAVCADDGCGLSGIVIASLPETGVLMAGGRVLMEGEAVTAPTLGALSYHPSPDSGRHVSFDFLPVHGDGSVGGVMTASLTVQSVDNRPPVAQDVEIKTYKNVAVTGMFRAGDPEGDALTFRITGKARRGEVEVTSDGRFVYTPFRNKSGSDTLTYVAVDAYGNLSQEAKVHVKIEKSPAKTTYADLDGHPAQYAALRLSGEDIFTGQQMCGHYYFRPDEYVSRAEMITMVVKAIGLDIVPVAATGFYDDADIPAWFKPYAQAALKAGVISGGRSPDGRAVLNAGSYVTVNQAAAIINNALRPADIPLESANPREDAVAVWSSQAIANLDAAGLFDDITVSAGDKLLTRGEIAMLLVRAIDVYNVSQPKSGLLSWVFGW